VFLSSVLWDFTSTFKQAIKDIDNGTYGTHGYNLSLSNGGISLLHSKYIPASVWAAMQAAKAKIAAGTIKIPVTHKAGDVQKLLK
jgi:simple sugar transport system substrate-binding protein